MNSVQLIIFLIFVVGVGLFLLLVFHFWVTRPQPDRELIDTFKVRNEPYSQHQLHEATRGQFIELGYDRATHQSAILAENERCMNVLNLGPTGTGKTSYFVSSFLWRDIARSDNAVVVFDATRGLTSSVLAMAREFHRPVRVFPDAGFNPLGGAGSARERAAAFADLLAQTPEVSGGASDYYSQVEQLFVRVIVPLFEAAYREPMVLRELLELAASEDRRLRLLADAGICPEAAEYHLHFDDWSAPDWKRNLSGLITFLDRLTVGKRAFLYNQRTAVSLEEAIEGKELILIREGGERHSQDRTLGLLFMVALQRYAASRDVARSPHLISVYLDEAHIYFNPNFPTFIATSRQKRLALQLGFQNFAQFAPFTETVISNARTWLVHGGLTFEDATLVANNIGQRQYVDHSIQYPAATHQGAVAQPTRQDSLVYDYLIRPHEIQGMAGDALLALSVRDREVEAMRLLKKPHPLSLDLCAFEEPSVSVYAPPTIWDERDQLNAATTHQPDAGELRTTLGTGESSPVASDDAVASSSPTGEVGSEERPDTLIPFPTERRSRRALHRTKHESNPLVPSELETSTSPDPHTPQDRDGEVSEQVKQPVQTTNTDTPPTAPYAPDW